MHFICVGLLSQGNVKTTHSVMIMGFSSLATVGRFTREELLWIKVTKAAPHREQINYFKVISLTLNYNGSSPGIAIR